MFKKKKNVPSTRKKPQTTINHEFKEPQKT